jgi:hypothetical protein
LGALVEALLKISKMIFFSKNISFYLSSKKSFQKISKYFNFFKKNSKVFFLKIVSKKMSKNFKKFGFFIKVSKKLSFKWKIYL